MPKKPKSRPTFRKATLSPTAMTIHTPIAYIPDVSAFESLHTNKARTLPLNQDSLAAKSKISEQIVSSLEKKQVQKKKPKNTDEIKDMYRAIKQHNKMKLNEQNVNKKAIITTTSIMIDDDMTLDGYSVYSTEIPRHVTFSSSPSTDIYTKDSLMNTLEESSIYDMNRSLTKSISEIEEASLYSKEQNEYYNLSGSHLLMKGSLHRNDIAMRFCIVDILHQCVSVELIVRETNQLWIVYVPNFPVINRHIYIYIYIIKIVMIKHLMWITSHRDCKNCWLFIRIAPYYFQER
jgi:predicted transcriptional regulator